MTFGDAHAASTTATFGADGVYVLRLTANDGASPASDTVQITVNPAGGGDSGLPPDPSTVAPSVDPTVATTTYAATEFLYTGTDPIQTGVAAGTIEPKRAAILRGRVLDRQNNPLPAVVITVLNHPEFGQTLSRADGRFDMAVNGGGYLTINYQRNGYLSAQRPVSVPWQDYVVVEDVVLIAADPQVTTVDLTASAIQVARGSVVSDASGQRQATLLVPPGTTAQVYNPDGTTRPVTALTLRATEYTVGENGPAAMPGPLPPTSAYTYAVELSAAEATIKKDGQDVLFNQPVPFYVDNFLNFPVGIQVPVAYYDKDKAAWIPSDDGRVIKILSITAGLADLDTDGDGQADTGAALGVTDAEREKLAQMYPAGRSLWRATLTHLSTYDLNWGFSPALGAIKPTSKATFPQRLNNPTCSSGSIIECENQTLGETLPVIGTPYSLNYRSDRVPGRKAANRLTIPLSDATVPSVLKRIDLEIQIAGRTFTQSFPAAPNQTHTFDWDGKDALGRDLQGAQPANVRIGYVYDGYYNLPPSVAQSFGFASGVPVPGNIPARREVTLWQEQTVRLEAWTNQSDGLGGWSLSVHHAYDPVGKVLYFGYGGQWSTQGDVVSTIIEPLAGNGVTGWGGDGGPATSANVRPTRVVAGPDGSLYIPELSNNRVRRVGPDGIITTVVGNGQAGYSGDGGPATNANLSGPQDVAVGADGSLYIADYFNNRVRRVRPDGIITTIAGNGQAGYSGDGGPATSASLQGPIAVAVGSDGSLYIADYNNNRVRQVGPGGRINTVAGNGQAGYGGDGGPATSASLNGPIGVAVGPDGSLYIPDSHNNRIRRVGSDGIITTVAGDGFQGFSPQGGLAINTHVYEPGHVAVGSDGNIYYTASHGVHRVGPDGLFTTVAGSGQGYDGDGGPAISARLRDTTAVAVGPDGNLYIADAGNNRVRRARPVLPGAGAGDLWVPSEDGSGLYHFDPNGRHLRTLDTLTGAVRFEFFYDSEGRLLSIKDLDGLETRIERSGNPPAIVAPFGQRTAFTVNGNGYLASVANPAGETHQLTYTADGLLTAFTDPKGNASQFTYDALGRLQRDANAAGGSQNLAYGKLTDGYTVTRTTALNRATTYTVENLPTGARQTKIHAPDGAETLTLLGVDGNTTITAPDGTVTESL